MKNEMKAEEMEMDAQAQAAEGKKDAEGQSIYHVYCTKCGWTGYHSDYNCYCTQWGCTGTLRRL